MNIGKNLKALVAAAVCSLLLIGGIALVWLSVSGAEEMKENITAAAQGAGNAAGFFAGSVEGVPYYREKYGEGKEKGLSAGETEVTGLTGAQLGDGKLQVLAATVSLAVDNQVGKNFAALALLRGNIVFSVDLGKAEIRDDTVTLPDVETRFVIDHRQTEIIDEYQNSFFNGSTEDGYDEFINSVKEIESGVERYVENYGALREEARKAAVEMVKTVAGNVSGKRYDVVIGGVSDDEKE